MKTGSNTAPRPITTCCVQFNVQLVQQLHRKSKIRPIFKFFPYTEIPLTQCKFCIEAVYFKKQDFYQRILHVGWNYSQFIFWILSHLFIRISIATTHRVSETTCFFHQVN